MQQPISSRQKYRLGYTDLHHRNGKAKNNVLADISLAGLAPVLRNPLCMHIFIKRLQQEVLALNLKNPSNHMHSQAIYKLKRMGYYCVEPPKGIFNKYFFYRDFYNLCCIK